MKAYRVENQKEKHGIWRDFDGKVCPVFSMLSEGKCRDMPMEDSDFYRHDGKQWFAATDTPEKLKEWFSARDVAEMEILGYSVIEFQITDCRVVSEYEIVFARDNIISEKSIDPYDIYGREYFEALIFLRKLALKYEELGLPMFSFFSELSYEKVKQMSGFMSKTYQELISKISACAEKQFCRDLDEIHTAFPTSLKYRHLREFSKAEDFAKMMYDETVKFTAPEAYALCYPEFFNENPEVYKTAIEKQMKRLSGGAS